LGDKNQLNNIISNEKQLYENLLYHKAKQLSIEISNQKYKGRRKNSGILPEKSMDRAADIRPGISSFTAIDNPPKLCYTVQAHRRML